MAEVAAPSAPLVRDPTESTAEWHVRLLKDELVSGDPRLVDDAEEHLRLDPPCTMCEAVKAGARVTA